MIQIRLFPLKFITNYLNMIIEMNRLSTYFDIHILRLHKGGVTYFPHINHTVGNVQEVLISLL